MGRFTSSMPMRPRSDRARRRVVFCAESLESRQLLSVAAFHPTIAPALNVPAAIGPVVPSAAVASAGTTGSIVSSVPVVQLTLQINPVVNGQVSTHGFTETIFIFEEPIASGIGATSPTTTTGGSSSPTGTNNPATGNTLGANTENTAITPLTTAVLAGPSGGNRVIIVVVAPQPVVAFFGSSTIPVTTQAILATATLEEQPLAPPVLGQGFESGQTQGGDPQQQGLLKAPTTPVPLEPQIPAIDLIEPFRPAPEQPPAAQPARPDDVPAQPAPAPNAEPAQVIPVEPAFLTDWDEAPDFPILSPRTESRTEAETPSWSMAAMVGTAAIAGGGYHLVLGGSNRFNQRWIPTRRSSKPTRRRHSQED